LPTLSIFALTANKEFEDQRVLETLGEDEEEYKTDFNSGKNLSSRHKFTTKLRDNEMAIASRSNYENRFKKNSSTLNNQELPSVSVSRIRNKESPNKKTPLIKQIKTRHPNSRLFKVDGLPDQFNNENSKI
jgi:hypothetical protein